MTQHPTITLPAEDASYSLVHTLPSTWDRVHLFFHKVRPHLIPALVILAASTCVLFWFRGFLLYYWDGFFPFNPSAVFRSFVWPWSDLISTGVPYTTSMGLPYIAIVYTLHDLFGLSLVVTEVVIYYLLLAAGGLGMYWFFISQANARISGFWQLRFGGLAAALIYMFNPYWMVYVWQIFSLEAFLYATLPFLLLLFQRGVAQAANRQSTWGTVTAIALVTVFASPALGNPALSIPLAVGFGVLFLLKLIPLGNLSKRLASMRFLLTAAVSIIAVNMWWLYPVSVLSKDHLIRAGGTSYGIEGLNDLVFNSAHTEYFNLLRLAGIVSFYRPPVYPHYDFAWMYRPEFLPMTILSLCVPITAFIGLTARSNTVTRVSQLFAGVCIITIIPLIAGARPPFGGLYDWVAVALPAASVMFRDPYQKLGFWLAFAFSFLIGVTFLSSTGKKSSSSTQIKKRLSIPIFSLKKRVLFLCILLLAMTVGFNWPMFTGDVVPDGSAILPSERIEIPTYYYEAAAWLQAQDGDFRILSLPRDQILQSSNWAHGYAGQDILRFLTGRSIISTDPLSPGLSDFQTGLYNYIYSGGENIANPLRVLSVKYVLLRLDAGFFPTLTPLANLTRIHDYLDAQKGLTLARAFGPLLFYSVENPGPSVFASSVAYSSQNIRATGWSLADYKGAWQVSSLNVTTNGSELHLSLASPGNYTYGYVSSDPLSFSGEQYPYMKVDFSSSENGAVLLRVNTNTQRDIWLTAVDYGNANVYGQNQYVSLSQQTLLYDLSSIPGSITEITIFVTNMPHPESHLNAGVVIHDIRFESIVLQHGDYVRVIAGVQGDPLLFPVSDYLNSTWGNADVAAPTIAYLKLSPVEYRVEVKDARQPFVLVLSETYDQRWNLSASQADVGNATHIEVDGFANGWMITTPGSFSVDITFVAGNGFLLAYYISIVACMSLVTITIITWRRRTRLHTR